MVTRWGASVRVGVVAVTVSIMAACGGGAREEGVTGAEWPDSLTAEETEALVTVPTPGDPAVPVATLTAVRPLTPEELEEELAADFAFAELEDDAVERGFGEFTSAVDLVYDNGVTLTAASLASSDDDVLRLAYRSSDPKPFLLLAQFDRAANELTTWQADGMVTLDLDTGESTAVESPEAHHSCSHLHCFQAALIVVTDIPLYGALAKKVCSGCGEALLHAWIAGTPVGQAFLSISCCACIATFGAALGAAGWVCADDPCDYCTSDSCGQMDTPSGVEYECRADDTRYWVSYDYSCEGISTRKKYYWFGETITDYGRTQCVADETSGIAERCAHGCDTPPEGESISRSCAAAPSECDPNSCRDEIVAGSKQCSQRPDDEKFVETQQVNVCGCVQVGDGMQCECTPTTQEIRVCSAEGCQDAASCYCPGAASPEGDPVCRRVTGTTHAVFQDWTEYYWNPPTQQCLQRTAERLVQQCDGACAADGQSCSASGTSDGESRLREEDGAPERRVTPSPTFRYQRSPGDN